jgi:hypothetical protein
MTASWWAVLTDAENSYKTSKDRRRQRKLLLDSIVTPVPRDLRHDLYSEEAPLVEIMTWGRYPWEFAHFTDGELADGLLQAAGKPRPDSRAGLIPNIHRLRVANAAPNTGADELDAAGQYRATRTGAARYWPGRR